MSVSTIEENKIIIRIVNSTIFIQQYHRVNGFIYFLDFTNNYKIIETGGVYKYCKECNCKNKI